MFGYVKTYQDELKMKEYNVFRSYYCGLCKTLKAEYGFCARLGLNYDSVFLAILLSAVTDAPYAPCAQRCIASPFKKKPVAQTNHCLSYSAAVMMILAILKLKDDMRDEHSIKAFFTYTALWRARRKIKKRYGDLYRACFEKIQSLSSLEKNKCDSVDEASHSFASVLETVFQPAFLETESDKRILGHIGYLLGRFIYILDAYEDLEDDRKKKSYNVFLLHSEPPEKDALRESLMFTLSSISNSYELLTIKQNKSILNNIIYLGLPRVLDQVLDGKGEKDERSV